MTWDKNLVLLVGGVGGAKLAYGLYHSMPPEKLTVIVNTGDDFWHYGLRICPDLDTITYTLGDVVNRQFGWGRQNDTFTVLDALRNLDDDPWFKLGDQDLATHMLRTQRLQNGEALTEITERFASILQIRCKIVPMSDDPVATVIHTEADGNLPFQTYFVQRRWQPRVHDISFAGIEEARLSDTVRDAIEQADAIVVGPSNPWLSIAPILAVPGLRDAIQARAVPRVAVTPLIAGDSVKGPTAKLMREFGLSLDARTILAHYGQVINGFVFDVRDANLLSELHNDRVRVTSMDTLMDTQNKRMTLAGNLLAWLEDWDKKL